MAELERYTKAMIQGRHDICAGIEQRYDLFGYPPEVVCIGLKAIDEGKSCDAAIGAYLAGADDAR